MCLTRDRRLVTCNAKNGICGIKLAGLVKRVQVSGMLCGIGDRGLYGVYGVDSAARQKDGQMAEHRSWPVDVAQLLVDTARMSPHQVGGYRPARVGYRAVHAGSVAHGSNCRQEAETLVGGKRCNASSEWYHRITIVKRDDSRSGPP